MVASFRWPRYFHINSYILGTACEKSAKEMMQRHNQYESDSTKKTEEAKAPQYTRRCNYRQRFYILGLSSIYYNDDDKT